MDDTSWLIILRYQNKSPLFEEMLTTNQGGARVQWGGVGGGDRHPRPPFLLTICFEPVNG